MSLQKYPSTTRPKRRKNLWFERFMAIAATTNLALIVFDLTYVPWRNFWLQGNITVPLIQQTIHTPLPTVSCPNRSIEKDKPPQSIRQSAIVCLYDSVKGIEPHRDTQAYLAIVNQLKTQLDQKGLEPGLRSPEVQTTLATLRQASREMIDSNPFTAANKSGTLEKIKNEIRRHVGRRINQRPSAKESSAKESFDIFWSTTNSTYPNYLSPSSWNTEFNWFTTKVQPLIETNFYRTISENGDPTNNFWALDAPFVILFFAEFLARTFYISRRYQSLSWLDTMIWRWYDIPLFLPFGVIVPVLAPLRALPTLIRLHQAELIDLHEINAKARQGFVAAIADEMIEVIVVQVVNQVQESIRRGEVSDWLGRMTSHRYVDINNVNEIEAIAQQLTTLAVYKIFPSIQPDLEALLRQSINSVLSQSPAYRGLQALPGIGTIPAQLTERIVSDLTQTAYSSLKTTLEDPQIAQLTSRLVQKLSNTLITEAQQTNFQDIQLLLSDLLEEIKINYIQRLSSEDSTLLLDQTRQLQESVLKTKP